MCQAEEANPHSLQAMTAGDKQHLHNTLRVDGGKRGSSRIGRMSDPNLLGY